MITNFDQYKAEYDGVECLSFREESFEEIHDTLKEAYMAGYTYVLVDDAFMMFKEQVEDSIWIASAGTVDFHGHLEEAAMEWWIDID